MIDVMHVISGLGTGGAETMLVQLAGRLRDRGLVQHVVGLTMQGELVAELKRAQIGATVLGVGSAASLPGAMTSIVSLVNELRPRIIQGWMYHGNLGAMCGHFFSRGRRERALYWNLRASNMDERRYGSIIRWSSIVSPLVDVVVANSQAGADFHRARGFRPKRSVVIDNGIETGRFCRDTAVRDQVRRELGIAQDAIVAVKVARVDLMKDHANFLAAMQSLPEVCGLLIGSGTTDLVLPANVKALGLRRDSERYLAASDIVVSTSAFGEGFSNVIAEGMSAELIPVATAVGDAARIVGETGWVVEPCNPAAIAEAIGQVAALSPDQRRQKGEAARRRIVENFTLERAVDNFARLYASY